MHLSIVYRQLYIEIIFLCRPIHKTGNFGSFLQTVFSGLHKIKTQAFFPLGHPSLEKTVVNTCEPLLERFPCSENKSVEIGLRFIIS